MLTTGQIDCTPTVLQSRAKPVQKKQTDTLTDSDYLQKFTLRIQTEEENQNWSPKRNQSRNQQIEP